MTAQMKTNASAKKAVNSPSHIYDTFIVGAGISGIAAAIRLDQVGYTNYKIIEKAGRVGGGTVAKLAMRQPFVLFKGLTFQKLCLPGAFRPGDHHNKMLRPGLCVVHASPQYL